jgi:hypothetical protein
MSGSRTKTGYFVARRSRRAGPRHDFSVVLIKHYLDVATAADRVIDPGPDGGRIVAQGPPERPVRIHRRSEAARLLRGFPGARTNN